ncbi:MAG TPA: oligosaccharide flippase family protein, partial [Dehalococcoidia bacterium]|nr:oligosaccharide flippase family protein [Dehalococcoidia bacterium]
MRWRRLADTVRDAPAKDLNLTAGTAFTFLISGGTYALVALTGIVVARKLGAHDRGVYSIVTTVALLYAAFAELGVSKAGIYLIGRGRYPLRQVAANNLSWLFLVGGLWASVMIALGLARSSALPGDLGPQHFLVFALGGSFLLLLVLVKDMLIGSGSLLGYNLLEFIEPFLRAVFIVVAVFVLGVGIVGVLFAWLLAVVLAAVLALRLLARRASLRPAFSPRLFREQLSFGLRSYLGFVFQAA